MKPIVAGFNLNRSNFSLVSYQKVNFHVVFTIACIATGIEIKLMPISPKHLGDDVFQNHALIDA
jgi:hypothetical protein